jgi:hypothetical protein
MAWAGHRNFGKREEFLFVTPSELEPKRGRSKMDTWTVALWCDVGTHAFSPSDPDKHSYTETKQVQKYRGNSYGAAVYQDETEVTATITMCGPCYKKSRPFQTDATPAQIPAGVDPQTYTEYLESLNHIDKE